MTAEPTPPNESKPEPKNEPEPKESKTLTWKDGSPFDPERAMALVEQLRKNEDDLAKRLKAFEDKDKTELERAQGDAQQAADRATALEKEVQSLRAERAIDRAAQAKGFLDPEDAVLHLSRMDIEADETGQPKKAAIDRALDALAAAKPHLVGGRPGGSGDGGARTPAPTGMDMNQKIREAAGR